jgi:hypothetical protein
VTPGGAYRITAFVKNSPVTSRHREDINVARTGIGACACYPAVGDQSPQVRGGLMGICYKFASGSRNKAYVPGSIRIHIHHML